MAWGAIRNGHPSYAILYGVTLLLGVFSLIRGSSRRFHRRWTVILGGSALIVLSAVAWWLTPFPADDVAVEALSPDAGYSVTDTATAILLSPDSPSGPGIIFQPGARVDARAYARILSGLAERGHSIVIVKQPLGIGFLAGGFPAGWASDHPETSWVVAGHSLGGVAATSAAAAVDGLVLWASFPASDLSVDLSALSIYGTLDTFTTTEDVESTADRLPPDTTFVAVDGGIHSYFGDYGLQPGDGTPGLSREEAQTQIVASTLAFLEQLSG